MDAEKEAVDRLAKLRTKEEDWSDITTEEVEKWPMVIPALRKQILEHGEYFVILFHLSDTNSNKLGKRDLTRALKLKRRRPHGQGLDRYLQVLQFMNWQLKYPEITRKEAAINVAIGFGRGYHVARRILRQEKEWIKSRMIIEGVQGKHAKVVSMLKDEGTGLAVRQYLEEAGESKRSSILYLHVILR